MLKWKQINEMCMSVNLIKYGCHNYLYYTRDHWYLSVYVWVFVVMRLQREAKVDIIWKYSVMFWALVINSYQTSSSSSIQNLSLPDKPKLLLVSISLSNIVPQKANTTNTSWSKAENPEKIMLMTMMLHKSLSNQQNQWQRRIL